MRRSTVKKRKKEKEERRKKNVHDDRVNAPNSVERAQQVVDVRAVSDNANTHDDDMCVIRSSGWWSDYFAHSSPYLGQRKCEEPWNKNHCKAIIVQILNVGKSVYVHHGSISLPETSTTFLTFHGNSVMLFTRYASRNAQLHQTARARTNISAKQTISGRGIINRSFDEDRNTLRRLQEQYTQGRELNQTDVWVWFPEVFGYLLIVNGHTNLDLEE